LLEISTRTLVFTAAIAFGHPLLASDSAEIAAIDCTAALTAEGDPWQQRFHTLFAQPLKMVESGSQKSDAPLEYIAHGIPKSAVYRYAGENEIFRHYASPGRIRDIIATGSVRAALLPYVVRSCGSRVSYVDVTGIFLTKPGFSAKSVGVSEDSAETFVDLKLPPNTMILELEPGILVVPGPPSLPNWLTAYAAQMATGAEIPNWVQPTLQRLQHQGALDRKPASIQVGIVESSSP
jgi:CubicO group peptidase (beta-lactamase class C family)